MSEETLDPENWDNLQKLGHKIVDDMVEHLKSLRDRPIWTQPPEDVLSKFKKPLPKEGDEPESIYDEIMSDIIPYGMGNIHPRFWGWVIGNGSYFGALGDFIASSVNYNSGGFNHPATYVENQVIEWTKEMLGFDKNASGLITNGGSMANFIGIAVAKNKNTGINVREDGFQSGTDKFSIYGSVEMHSSIQKAVELQGLGNKYLRKISVNNKYQIDIDQLKKTINKDIEMGYKPFCLIGNLGTVNTGAVDDLNELSKIAIEYNLWFHIDGAFGALTHITPDSSQLANGLQSADSIAFDFHKWLYVNYEAGCILIKNESDHRKTFSLTPDYIAHSTRGLHGMETWFADYGVQLSRNFKALKIWMLFKEHGIEKYGRLVQQNINQANYLSELVIKNEKLELMAPTSMNIVCFRYNVDKSNQNPSDLNQLNEEIVFQLHEKGIAIPSFTKLNNNYVIRVAITNHRSRKEDFEFLVESIIEIGDQLRKNVLS
ncbi:MAG: pyridoxal phosphate-dependent decarboxylase family protein [Candidatus Hodarchaeales archaeon]|jgi:glutamate/tyrosine decarboxylase-like PLP-dependent enzyme